MASKKTKKTGRKAAKSTVTLYAEGLEPREFNPIHAARLLRRPNTKWAKEPWTETPDVAKPETGEENGNGSSNNSGNTAIGQDEE